MMMGHYSAAFVASRAAPGLPLWAAFLAVQLVDIAFAVFVLAGIETVGFDRSLASNPLVLDWMPYTHSLVGTLAFAALAYAIARRFAPAAGARAALAAAAAVVSHWPADVLVHRPDMTIEGGVLLPRLGLALWDVPAVALATELGLLLGAAVYFCSQGGALAPRRGPVLGLAIAMAGFQLASTWLEPPQVTPAQFAVSALALFLLLAALARVVAGSSAERG